MRRRCSAGAGAMMSTDPNRPSASTPHSRLRLAIDTAPPLCTPPKQASRWPACTVASGDPSAPARATAAFKPRPQLIPKIFHWRRLKSNPQDMFCHMLVLLAWGLYCLLIILISQGTESTNSGLASALNSMEFCMKTYGSEANNILEDLSKAINLVHTRRNLVENDRVSEPHVMLNMNVKGTHKTDPPQAAEGTTHHVRNRG